MQVEAALHQLLDCGCQCSSSTTEMEAARKKRDSLPYVPLIVLWPEGAKRHIASGGPGCEGHITNELIFPFFVLVTANDRRALSRSVQIHRARE